MSYMETSVINFGAAMSIKLGTNQAEKGNSWVTCDIGYLQRKLGEKMEEYWGVERDTDSADALVDVANFCMMLYYRHLDSHDKEVEKMDRRELRVLLRCAKEEIESAVATLDQEDKQ